HQGHAANGWAGASRHALHSTTRTGVHVMQPRRDGVSPLHRSLSQRRFKLVAKSLTDIQQKVQMGIAKVDLNLCYSYTDFVCGTCLKACPVGALQTGMWARPIVNTDACVGCGLCERVCIR